MSEAVLNQILAELSEIRGNMATKAELAELRSEMAELRSEMADMRTGMTEMRGEMTDMRSQMATKKDVEDIKQTLAQHGDMITQLIHLNGRMHAEMTEGFRQTDRQMRLLDSDIHTLAKQVNEHEFKINRITDVYEQEFVKESNKPPYGREE